MSNRAVVEGDKHKKPPRVSSTYNWTTYEDIVEIGRQIDFNHPRFDGKYKRNNSWGSAQAFIVELALSAPQFREYIRQFMIQEGRFYTPISDYRRIQYSDSEFKLQLNR